MEWIPQQLFRPYFFLAKITQTKIEKEGNNKNVAKYISDTYLTSLCYSLPGFAKKYGTLHGPPDEFASILSSVIGYCQGTVSTFWSCWSPQDITKLSRNGCSKDVESCMGIPMPSGVLAFYLSQDDWE